MVTVSNRGRIGQFWSETAYWLSFWKPWLFALVITVLVCAFGAFDTGEIPSMSARLWVSISVMAFSGLSCALLCGVVYAFSGRTARDNMFIAVCVGYFQAIPSGVLWRFSQSSFSETPMEVVLVLRSVFHSAVICSMVLLFLFLVKYRHQYAALKSEKEPVAADPINTPTYMKSEDHYLRIIWDDHEELVRAPIAQKSEEYSDKGMRCHRSYWVAYDAIQKRRREGRQLLLILKNGLEIPVGRSYEAAIIDVVP